MDEIAQNKILRKKSSKKIVKYVSFHCRNHYLSPVVSIIAYQDEKTIIIEHPEGWMPSESEIKRYSLHKYRKYHFSKVEEVSKLDSKIMVFDKPKFKHGVLIPGGFVSLDIIVKDASKLLAKIGASRVEFNNIEGPLHYRLPINDKSYKNGIYINCNGNVSITALYHNE